VISVCFYSREELLHIAFHVSKLHHIFRNERKKKMDKSSVNRVVIFLSENMLTYEITCYMFYINNAGICLLYVEKD